MSEEKSLTLKGLKKDTDERLSEMGANIEELKVRVGLMESAIKAMSKESDTSPEIKALEDHIKSVDLHNNSRMTSIESRMKRMEEASRPKMAQIRALRDAVDECRRGTLVSTIAIACSVLAIVMSSIAIVFGGVL